MSVTYPVGDHFARTLTGPLSPAIRYRSMGTARMLSDRFLLVV